MYMFLIGYCVEADQQWDVMRLHTDKTMVKPICVHPYITTCGYQDLAKATNIDY